ncbi:MAG: hypothetical protein IJT34_07955, partial [Butyrivibrio sp.]|nr:hypothetical protein [Butyrivibrio sp.]
MKKMTKTSKKKVTGKYSNLSWLADKISVDRSSIVTRIFCGTVKMNVLSYSTYAIGLIVDGIVTGTFLGVDAVAAIGLAYPALMAFSLVGSCIGGGVRSRVSQLMGAGDVEGANRTLSLGFWVTVIASALLAVLAVVFAGPLAVLLGATGRNARLMEPMMAYLIGRAIGLPFSNAISVLYSLLTMDGDAKRGFYYSVAETVVNILLDYLVIIVLHTGLFGMGLATSIGSIAGALVIVPHFFSRKYNLRIGFKLAELSELKEILRRGTSSLTNKLSGIVKGLLINRILAAYLTAPALAAFALQNQMVTYTDIFMGSVTDTTLILASVFNGEEDRKSLDLLQQLAFKLGGVINLALAILMFAFSVPLAGLYLGASSPEAIPLGADSIRFYALSILLLLVFGIFLSYTIGIANQAIANTLLILRNDVILIPVTWLMVIACGERGAWIAPIVSIAILLVLYALYVLRRPEESVRDRFLMLPKGFGVGAERDMDMSIETQEDVQMLSRIALMFCLENGVSEERGKVLSLAIEEM